MCSRICNVDRVPDVSSDSIQNGFNRGFSDAYKEIMTEMELYDLEDVYWSALFTMEKFEDKNHIARQFVTIIRYRLKKLRALSRQMEQ